MKLDPMTAVFIKAGEADRLTRETCWSRLKSDKISRDISVLNIYRRTSGSCSRFILARDCLRPPVSTSWLLPHASPHLGTAHFRSQEHGRGTRYRPVSSPRRPSLHSGDYCKLFCSSDNCVNNTKYCVVVLKCLHSASR